MKNLFHKHAIILAALLQVLPIVRNIVTNPAANSTFAIILRWCISSGTALGAVDAVSGASNNFTSTNVFTSTVGTLFTNNLTLKSSGQDAGASTVITSNSVSVFLSVSGQSTNFAMPSGLVLQFQDNSSLGANPVYDDIHGIPTTPGTNTFTITLQYQSHVVSTNITINILGGSSPPIITNNPASVTTNVGNNVTFSVTNGGTAPFKYQWYFNTNTSLLNATNSSVTLTNVQLTNTGTYSVTITNSVGGTNSTFALLTVWQPPVITNQPANFTNVAGANASFSAVAGGTPTLNYQWQFNTNTALLSATNSSLNLTNIRASQAGTYSVILTNSAGSLTSAPALLVVTAPAPPQIAPPVVAAGIFQFTFNPVVGLTNSVLTNDSVGGESWIVMTNVSPPATTNAVTVSDTISGTNRFYRVQIIP